MYWADVTVPSAITFIGVPVLAAISRPVCVDDLILLLTPYLDDIVPVIGNVAISIPSILAIPCERREYGVGYTNIVEALPYYIPILMTHNPDIHIDLEKENIGYLIEPYDVETWKEKIIYLKQHPEVIETMSKHAKKLTEGEYNAQTTASYIINDFIRIIQ